MEGVQNTMETLKKMKENESNLKEEKNEKGIFEVNVKQEIEISEEDFGEYISCRNSGLTNMFDLKNVEMITGLEKNKLKAITSNFELLVKKYGEDF